MRSATTFFQGIMRGHGEPDVERYVLTAIRTADTQGFTLYAVCRRPVDVITVVDKLNPTQVRRYTRDQLEFYQPFAFDAEDKPLDTIIDWAGLPRTNIRTQKAQAILMTLAANSILTDKHRPDYWSIERRWISGQFYQVAVERDRGIARTYGTCSLAALFTNPRGELSALTEREASLARIYYFD